MFPKPIPEVLESLVSYLEVGDEIMTKCKTLFPLIVEMSFMYDVLSHSNSFFFQYLMNFNLLSVYFIIYRLACLLPQLFSRPRKLVSCLDVTILLLEVS